MGWDREWQETLVIEWCEETWGRWIYYVGYGDITATFYEIVQFVVYINYITQQIF